MLKRSHLFRALAHRRLYLGAPKPWSYINAALCSFPLFAFHMMVFMIVFCIGQYCGYLLWHRDPEKLSIYIQYIKQADQYTYTSQRQKHMKRPEGFGRTMPSLLRPPHVL